MDEKRMVMIGVGVVLLVSTITILAVTMSGKSDQGEDNTVKANRTNPLLLISLDGFRSDYFFRYVPTLEQMAKNGVKARFMMPSYPTVTFPNHYTIVTGLYPESHGIVANYFYDPSFNATFSMAMDTNTGEWWEGEPIWNTLTNQNKTSATFFWPGSDKNISDQFPTEYRPFDISIHFADRVDQVVEWLSRPEETRPDWVSLYLEEPDSTGHDNGPSAVEVDDMLAYVDGMMARLLSGLRRNGMEDKVNIIVLADHGMAQAGANKVVDLAKYIPEINTTAPHITTGAFTMLKLKDQSEASVNSILNTLSCPPGAPYIRAFLPQDLPTRFHYSNNPRIGDIVLDFDTGYYTAHGYTMEGEHGYDNHRHSMEALFIATGPAFKKGVTLEPFQNIEIYNLMCLLTDVEPAPNNGTEGALYAALIDPPDTPELPMEDEPPSAPYPAGGPTNETLAMSNCRINISPDEKGQLEAINISPDEQLKLADLHLPLGFPLTGDLPVDVLLLYHKDHVTGYSQRLKMPLWTSFTVNTIPESSRRNDSLWLSDVRLNKTNTQTCDSYANKNLTMRPLFPPELSVNKSLDLIPYLVSNAVPVKPTTSIMNYLNYFLEPLEMNQNQSINVLLGPVFDHDADSLPDDYSNFTSPQVPSDLFMVVTRCKDVGVSVHDCRNESLDAFSFIFPEHQTVNNNCKEELDYVYGSTLFLSTLHDVELATGLTFLAALYPDTRLRLSLKIHTNLWQIITG